MPTLTGILGSHRDSTLGDLRLWIGHGTTVGGEASFFPTEDGTAQGAALFSKIELVLFGGEEASGLVTAQPLTALKSVAADRKTVIAHAGVGTVLGLLGATLVNAPDGTIVHCLVIGT